MVESETPLPMLTKVRIKHFRSIEDTEFTLEPLTVLVGPNASGKSNVVDVFAFLGDVARDGLESAVTKRGGIDGIGWRSGNGKPKPPEFQFSFENLGRSLQYGFALNRSASGECVVNRETAKLVSSSNYANSSNVLREIEFRGNGLVKPSPERLARGNSKADTKRQPEGNHRQGRIETIKQQFAEQPASKLRLLSSDSSRSLFTLLTLLNQNADQPQRSHLRLRQTLTNAQQWAMGVRLYHLFPNTLRHPQPMADSRPLRSDASNLASTLSDLLRRDDSFGSEVKVCLSAAVDGVADIRVTKAGSHHVVELKHRLPGDPSKGMWFDLLYEADGTIRLLAMLTAFYQDPWPSLVCLEEPEVGIHPGALAVMRDVLLEAPLRSQVLVTTHSPELIDMLPVESLRAVSAESGSTKVGPIAKHQFESAKETLFTAGEIHRMEGLYPQPVGGQIA